MCFLCLFVAHDLSPIYLPPLISKSSEAFGATPNATRETRVLPHPEGNASDEIAAKAVLQAVEDFLRR